MMNEKWLLTDGEMKRVFGGACYSTVCDDCTHGCKFIAEAQLKEVVGGINKVLVKYSVVDGRLSAYIDGTTPIWALPNIDWQVLLEEVK